MRAKCCFGSTTAVGSFAWGPPPLGVGNAHEARCWTLSWKLSCGSSVDKYRNLGVGEYLDRLAAEYERSDAATTVRGHDDKVTTLRLRGIDDCLVRMFMLDMHGLARQCLLLPL